MAKRNPVKSVNNNNLLWAVCGLLAISLLASGFTALSCEWVLQSFQDSNTMAMLITDAGLVSDDKNLERQLTDATIVLGFLRDVGYAVVVGSLGVCTAILVRIYRFRKSQNG